MISIANLFCFKNRTELRLALMENNIDVALLEEGNVRRLMKNNFYLGILKGYAYRPFLGCGFPKKNAAFWEEFNRFLRGAKQDGSYRKMIDRWFSENSEPDALPAGQTEFI